jgi:opacity protein-like surface antigen
MRKLSIVSVGTLLATLLAPVGVFAQQQESPQPAAVRRPFRGLFGAPPGPNSGQSLDFTASLFGAYDDDIFAAETGVPSGTAGIPASGWFAGAQAGLAYGRRTRRANFTATGDIAMNHYPSHDEHSLMYRTAVGLGVQLTGRTHLGLDGVFAYAPYYRLGLIPSATDPSGFQDPFGTVSPDYNLYRTSSYRSSGDITLSRTVSRHSTLSASYSIGLVDYVHEDLDYRSQGAAVQFAHQMTSNMSFHFGYAYSTAEYTQQSSLSKLDIHNLDIGVNYGRALSISRRTHLSFSTGSAMIVSDATPLDRLGRDWHYRLLGSATLTHEMGRTWTALASYSRDVAFHEGFNEPLLSDGVSAGLSGLLSRRLQFSSSAGYSFGIVGFNSDNDFYALSADAGVQYALSRIFALYARYVYYTYEFDSPATLDPRFARALDRQGVRIGLQASLPLMR